MTLRIFQREVERQCRFAAVSLDALNAANEERAQLFNDLRSGQVRSQDTWTTNIRTWYAIQTFLVAAANISKILWGSKQGEKQVVKQRQRDRRELRASLGVAENSILRLSPEFRNHFEHLDERIEEWAAESTNMHADDIIGPPNTIGGMDAGDVFRSYDPSTHILTFRGETFDMPSVAEAIGILLPVVHREASKPHWDEPDESGTAAGAGQ